MSYQTGIINNLIENTIEIFFPDEPDTPPVTQENIVSESMSLRQTICDGEQLRFGGCVASQFSIKLMNTAARQFDDTLTGKWIAVKITQRYADPDVLVYPSDDLYPSDSLYPGRTTGEQVFWVFSGFIDSVPVDKNDRNIYNVTAYDALAKLHSEDATDDLFQRFKTHGYYLEQIFGMCTTDRGISATGFLAYLNETYTVNDVSRRVGAYNVKNDYWLNRKDRVTYGTLLRYVCELLGVFGVMVPDSGKGYFTFRTLNGSMEAYGFYEQLTAENYQSTGYTDFRFSVSGNARNSKSVTSIDGGLSDAASGAVDKTYDFSDNILVLEEYTESSQGRTSTPFDYLINRTSIGTRLALNAASASHSGQCAFSAYHPLEATLDGRLWVSVGAPIEILVNRTTVDGDYVIVDGVIQKETVRTYVLTRTLTGIQALTDNIEVKGVT